MKNQQTHVFTLMMTAIMLLISAIDVAHAEVMDKEPLLIQNFIWGITASIVIVLATRFKPWLLLVILPLPIIYFVGLIGEIRDPYVGANILKEAGEIYIYSAYGLCVLMLLSIFFGIGWRWIIKRRTT